MPDRVAMDISVALRRSLGHSSRFCRLRLGRGDFKRCRHGSVTERGQGVLEND